MKNEFEVDTSHAAQTLIALGASGVIDTVAVAAYDKVIAILATLFISVITIVAIKEQTAKSKKPSSSNN